MIVEFECIFVLFLKYSQKLLVRFCENVILFSEMPGLIVSTVKRVIRTTFDSYQVLYSIHQR